MRVNLTADTVSTLALVACAVAVLALVVAAGAQLRLAQVKARYRILWAGSRATDVATVMARQDNRIGVIAAGLESVRGQVGSTQADLAQSLRHVAVVRYDAFGDRGGRLSFSTAILDDRGDGIVISSIHARSESRTYAKGIVGGNSDVILSPEEQQALAAARTGKGSAA